MFKIQQAQNEEDLDTLIEFCHLVHDRDDRLPDYERILKRNPFNPVQSHYYMKDGDQVVTMLSLLPSPQYFAGQPLNVGQISLVGTHPNYRQKGLARQLLLGVIQKAVFPLYYLYGIPNFYEAFDFSFAIPSFHPRIQLSKERLEHLPPKSSAFRVRKFRSSDRPALMELYHQAYSQNNCAIIRSQGHWEYYLNHFEKSENYHLKVILNMKGQLQGYVWLSTDDGVLIREAVSLVPEVSDIILREARFYLKQTDDQPLYIQTPQNHAFAQHCYQRGAAFYSSHSIYYGVWGGMYRIINLKECLFHLLPSFQARLAHSRYYDWEGNLGFHTQNTSWGLNITKQEIKLDMAIAKEHIVIDFPLSQLNACFTQYSGLECPTVKNSDIQKILAILFPQGFPFISEIDNIDELV